MIYVTQRTNHNLAPAMDYGEIHDFMFDRDHPPLIHVDPNWGASRCAKLDDFNPDKDYLLTIGDPVVIGLCMATLLHRFPFIMVLKYDRQSFSYLPVRVNSPVHHLKRISNG